MSAAEAYDTEWISTKAGSDGRPRIMEATT